MTTIDRSATTQARRIEIRKYVVSHNGTGKCVYVTYAPSEIAALDEYAADRSGYATHTEMARSATFRDAANVSASRA